jgi:hypothetical protein
MEQDVFLSPENISFEMPAALDIDVVQFAIDPRRLLCHYTTQSYSLGYMFGTFLGDGNSRLEKGVLYGAEQGYIDKAAPHKSDYSSAALLTTMGKTNSCFSTKK